MFEIILYNNRAEPNRLDKTTYLDRYISLRGTLKTSTSIINPSIIIQFENKREYVVDDDNSIVLEDGNRVVDTTELAKFLQANYAHIPTFNRYYFITDIISIRNNIWEVQMSVDVLMSFKSEILNQKALISRNEFEYDNFLVDDNVPTKMEYTKTIYTYGQFKTSLNGNTYIWSMGNPKYLIMVLNDISVETIYTPTFVGTPTVSKLSTCYYFDNTDDFSKFWEEVLYPSFWDSFGEGFANRSDYIVSQCCIPLDLKSAVSTLYNEVPPDNLIGLSAIPLPVVIGENPVSVNFSTNIITNKSRIKMWSEIYSPNNIPYDDFTDANPISKYYLYLPFIGVVELSSDRIATEMYKYVVYDIDVLSGDFIATLSKDEPTLTEDSLNSMDVWRGNMYIQLPLGKTNKAELQRNALELGLNTATSLITGGIGLGFNVSKGKSMTTPKRKQVSKKGKSLIDRSVKSFTTSATSTVLNTITSIATDFIPSGHVDGIPDSILQHRLGVRPWIIKITPKYYYPQSYNHLYGRPYMQYGTLSGTHGFTVLEEIHLEDFVNTTIDELNEIEDILLSGVILP